MRTLGSLMRVACAGLGLGVFAAHTLAAEQLSKEPAKTTPATHITKDQIQDFIAKLPKRIVDLPIRTVDVGGYQVGVFAVVRPKDSPQMRSTTTRT
jgi:hypothetical protein